MRALVGKSDGDAGVEEMERPDGETVVETLRLGIDGTDRHVISDVEDRMPDGAGRMVLGHEAVGRVVESDRFEEGQLVVPTVRRPVCGCEYAKQGRTDLCPPGHYVERGIEKAHGYGSDYFAEDQDEYLVPIPDGIEDLGVLLEPLSVVLKGLEELYSAQERLDYSPRKALVLGGGPIGLLATTVLRDRGLEVETMDIVDYDHPKAKYVRKTGATYIDNRERGIEDLQGHDLVVEASGVSHQIFKAMKHMNPNGGLVSLGLPSERGRTLIDSGHIHEELVLKNKTVIGSVNSSVPHFERAVELLQDLMGNYPVHRLIDVHVDLENWEEAFESADIKGEIIF